MIHITLRVHPRAKTTCESGQIDTSQMVTYFVQTFLQTSNNSFDCDMLNMLMKLAAVKQNINTFDDQVLPDLSTFFRRAADCTGGEADSTPSNSVRSPPGRIPSENITCFGSTVDRTEPVYVT